MVSPLGCVVGLVMGTSVCLVSLRGKETFECLEQPTAESSLNCGINVDVTSDPKEVAGLMRQTV